MKKFLMCLVGFVFFAVGSCLITNNMAKNIEVVNATDEENKVSHNKIFANTAEDKRALLKLMINATNYYDTATGSFDYYSENANDSSLVEFAIDTVHNLSYEKNIYKNKITRNISEPYEENIFDGQYVITYRNEDCIHAFSDERTKEAKDIIQFMYTPINYQELDVRSTGEDDIEDRVVTEEDGSTSYVKKVDPTFMGITKTVLLPEDFAIGFLGKDLESWQVIENEKYLNRDSVVVENQLSDYYKNKHNAKKCVIRVDSATGIVLEAHLIDDNNHSTFKVKMNSLSINGEINSKLFTKFADEIAGDGQ